jgi:hypothetical protein
VKTALLLLAIAALVVTSAFAAKPKDYTVTLNDYCDIWDLQLDNGNTGVAKAPQIYVWGTHDLLSRCNEALYDTIGQKHAAAATVPPNTIYGTSEAVLDVSDTEVAGIDGDQEPIEFLLRVPSSSDCGVAAYEGGTNFGGNFYVNEDTCTVADNGPPGGAVRSKNVQGKRLAQR